MPSVRKFESGEVIPLRRPEQIRVDADAGLTPRAPVADALDNVVPFARPPSEHAPAIIAPVEDAPKAERRTSERVRLALFAALSLALHAGLFFVFWREPEPLASIGLEAMSVEIVLGANAPAGVAPTPGENEVDVSADERPSEQPQEQQVATVQPQDVPVAPQEKAPEQTSPEAPPPEEKPPEPKVERPVEAAPPKPVKNAAPAKEPRRIDAPTREHAARQAKATPQAAANNVGVGRSDADSNYPGIVSAHLRRYQQYPADARNNHQQGTATVSFSLDGGGRVTAARLARGSGVASIDAEVQAMVRRASPFPAPPSGRPHSFTVPVSFRLN
jgi:protein TonB